MNPAREALRKAKNRCSFPGCNVNLVDAGGMPYAEVCHIEAYSPGGPRFDPDKKKTQSVDRHLVDVDNLIVLCPNHHRLVDARPEEYTVEWLRRARAAHERSLETLPVQEPDFDVMARRLTSFEDCLKTWEANADNNDEEFWHQLLDKNPQIIAQAVPDCIVKLGDKCYVGGKNVLNSGGKVVDFVYEKESTRNVVLVEIKTPATKLIGKEYRSDVFSISEDLSGAIVQVLNYRNQLAKNFNSLRMADRSSSFEVFDPKCMVVAGNTKLENLSPAQQASFDLFRGSSSVTIITYDELFAKIANLVAMINPTT